MERISRERLLMEVALLVKSRASCGRGQVGCVISRAGRIISSGYNAPKKGLPHCEVNTCDLTRPCTHTVHAEYNAIEFARDSNIDLMGTTIFITTAPCRACAEAILSSGISQVVYYGDYRSRDGIELLIYNKIKVWHWNTNLTELFEL